jgi:cellulose synthase/poly-beta-1,6-N-acetylglucosamine synthase-like glycosyltransferase
MTWALVLLGAAFLLIGYAYVGYPICLLLLPRRTRAQAAPSDDSLPLISITLPVYNEEATLAATLEHVLALDYPVERRQILVVSDASTDRTDSIATAFAPRGVELLRVSKRGGKTAAENAACALLTGEIVVNLDASISIPKGSLKALVAAFRDPRVGVASGRDVSVSGSGDSSNRGESSYVGYEMWVRDLETGVQSIVGASGCFFAARRVLHGTLVPEALSRDFAAALIAREQGYEAVSVKEAICRVPRTPSLRREYRRKVRTITRGMETLYYKRHLLDPRRFGVFAWMLFSHKVCRWLVPWAGLGGLVGLGLLAVTEPWARWALALAALGGALAAAGWAWPEERHMPSLLALPASLVSGNLAVLQATVRAIRGDLTPIWEPTRRHVNAAGATRSPSSGG